MESLPQGLRFCRRHREMLPDAIKRELAHRDLVLRAHAMNDAIRYLAQVEAGTCREIVHAV